MKKGQKVLFKATGQIAEITQTPKELKNYMPVLFNGNQLEIAFSKRWSGKAIVDLKEIKLL